MVIRAYWVDSCIDLELVDIQESGVRSSSVETERVKDDLARIEAMTVQELRASLR